MAPKREYIFIGYHEGLNGEKYRAYVDLVTKNTFTVGPDESIEEALLKDRERFNNQKKGDTE